MKTNCKTSIMLLLFFVGCKQPEWGLLQAKDNVYETKQKMNRTEVNIVRVPVYFSDNISSSVADDYLRQGYQVQLNFNWKPTGTPVGFPTDARYIRIQAHRFFFHYLLYRDLIPVVVVENEWDNLTSLGESYHTGTIQEYLDELKIVTQVGHQYGFKIADAGITGNNLQRWTYSRLTGDSAKWWKQNYFVGLDNDYQKMVDTVNFYAKGIRDIPIDYINLHWYNNDKCPGGYPTGVKKYMDLAQKKVCINNEFGIKRSSNRLFRQTTREIRKSGAAIGVIYSGTPGSDQAVHITDDMLEQLK